MTTRSRLIIGAFSIAMLAGVAIISVGENADQRTPERPGTSPVMEADEVPDAVAFSNEMHATCVGQPMTCDSGRIEALAGKAGLQTAFATYAKALEVDDWAVQRCHTTTHQVGRWAYSAAATTIDQVVLAGGPACEWGYLHGSLEAWGQDVGPDVVAEHAGELCDLIAGSDTYATNYNDSICTHAIGHSLGWAMDDLTRAVPLCDDLGRPDAIASCAEGVVMLYLQRDIETTGHSNPVGYRTFCTGLDGLAGEVCGQEYGSVALADSDPATGPGDAMIACHNAATSPAAEACADITGRQIAMSSQWDQTVIVLACAAGGELERSCLTGAVAAHSARPGAPDVAGLCEAMAPERAQEVCANLDEA